MMGGLSFWIWAVLFLILIGVEVLLGLAIWQLRRAVKVLTKEAEGIMGTMAGSGDKIAEAGESLKVLADTFGQKSLTPKL